MPFKKLSRFLLEEMLRRQEEMSAKRFDYDDAAISVAAVFIAASYFAIAGAGYG